IRNIHGTCGATQEKGSRHAENR
ncbi:MAG: hypothetical protein RLZZ143_1373, partial [Cyanobacteriota bacterium]